MEIDITAFIETFGDCPEQFSDSIANSGLQDIGAITWRAAVSAAEKIMLITDANRDDIIDHFAGYGAWERDELKAYTDAELNALLIQFIAGDYQTYRHAEEKGPDAFVEYQENHGGSLYQAHDGRWFYYVGV